MTPKRGATALSGVLPIDKPPGMTSHDVVARVRRATGEGRVGHAGTLDPMATGLLVILVGPMTRLSQHLSASAKRYEAAIVFGAETDTDDAEGRLTRTAEVPPEVLDESAARAAVASLVGSHQQVPPAYSAIKIDGRKAYDVARHGGEPALEARTAEVRAASLTALEPGPPPVWRVAMEVSKGTYVRAIARDLGRSLGTAAHLGALRRTGSGALRVENAVSLEDVEAAAAEGALGTLFADPVGALGLPIRDLGSEEASLVSHGHPLDLEREDGAVALVAVTSGLLLGIYEPRGDALVPVVVLPVAAA